MQTELRFGEKHRDPEVEMRSVPAKSVACRPVPALPVSLLYWEQGAPAV